MSPTVINLKNSDSLSVLKLSYYTDADDVKPSSVEYVEAFEDTHVEFPAEATRLLIEVTETTCLKTLIVDGATAVRIEDVDLKTGKKYNVSACGYKGQGHTSVANRRIARLVEIMPEYALDSWAALAARQAAAQTTQDQK